MKLSLSYFLFCIIFSTTYSYRIFHNGQMRGGNLGQPKENVLYKEARNFTRWLTQRLDHFDNNNLATWQQRYYVNDDYVSSSRNVAFLMIAGEGEDWMTNGAWTDFAKNFSAILFQLEHRFYGESRPTADISVENLKFLTSKQALADIAAFITKTNKAYKLSPVKWIVFGGSYAGSLAAWARLKYPHLIQGAVSSSAPLLAIVDFQEYHQVVAEDLQAVSAECYSAVQKGIAQIDTFLQDIVGQRAFTKLFKLCDPIEESINNKNDIARLYINLADTIAARQSIFQTCNKFGFYQTSTEQPHIFGNKFPVEFYLQKCVDIYGSEFNASYVHNAVNRTNTDYGALLRWTMLCLFMALLIHGIL